MSDAPIEAIRVMIEEGTICGARRITDNVYCGLPLGHSDDGPQGGHGAYLRPTAYEFTVGG